MGHDAGHGPPAWHRSSLPRAPSSCPVAPALMLALSRAPRTLGVLASSSVCCRQRKPSDCRMRTCGSRVLAKLRRSVTNSDCTGALIDAAGLWKGGQPDVCNGCLRVWICAMDGTSTTCRRSRRATNLPCRTSPFPRSLLSGSIQECLGAPKQPRLLYGLQSTPRDALANRGLHCNSSDSLISSESLSVRAHAGAHLW